MTATLIEGAKIAERLASQTAGLVRDLRAKRRTPMLVALLAGDAKAAASYARSQAMRAEKVGIDYRLEQFPASATTAEIVLAVDRLNCDRSVSGIMFHLPAPPQIDAAAIQERIAAVKDVEGVGAANLGMLALGRDALAPCTAFAAFECIKFVCPDMTGRRAVVVGRSPIVGKPLAMLLLAANATVTQCHSKTRDLARHTREAEILIAAIGKPGFIRAEHVGRGAIVVDVGTNRVEVADAGGAKKTRTVGDVFFDDVSPIASAITPVPGGVGPVTVEALLANTAAACARSSY